MGGLYLYQKSNLTYGPIIGGQATIKTDNHSTFTNYYLGTNKRSDMTVKTLHALDRFCAQHNINPQYAGTNNLMFYSGHSTSKNVVDVVCNITE